MNATSSNSSSVKPLRIAILGYAYSELVPPWDPSNCETGLPGSEECVVYGSEELARQGHQVMVYANPPKGSPWSKMGSNPRWLPAGAWSLRCNPETYDLVLMWRQYNVELGRMRSQTVFFWPHDSPPGPPSPHPFPKFDGLCLLSEHHRSQFNYWPEFKERTYILSGNGVVPEHFRNTTVDGKLKPTCTNPYSIGYFSNYARGLTILLRFWPQIHEQFPEATLDIYYGRETWGTMSKENFEFAISKIEEYSSLGVRENGKVGHQELANAMERISIWAYPCIEYGETFCITAVKAQMAGCIPVTTRIAALNETIHPDAPSIPIISTCEQLDEYRDLLLITLGRIGGMDPEALRIALPAGRAHHGGRLFRLDVRELRPRLAGSRGARRVEAAGVYAQVRRL